MEIKDDIIKEGDEKDIYSLGGGDKKYKQWEKRLNRSAGKINMLQEATVFLNEKGKCGDPFNERMVWDVQFGDGSAITVKGEVQAEMISLLIQINERLKCLEQKIDSITHSEKKK